MPPTSALGRAAPRAQVTLVRPRLPGALHSVESVVRAMADGRRGSPQVSRAVEQAMKGGGGQTGTIEWAPADEIALLVVHGVLHLCGWDHAEANEEAAMRRLEMSILASRPRRG